MTSEMRSELVDPPPHVSEPQERVTRAVTRAVTRTCTAGALGDKVRPGRRASIRHTVASLGGKKSGFKDRKYKNKKNVQRQNSAEQQRLKN